MFEGGEPCLESICGEILSISGGTKRPVSALDCSFTDQLATSQHENFTQIVYMPSICLTKTTIILQFIRLSVVGGRNSRWCFLQALLWLNLTFCLILMFLEIFQCTPRVKIWKPTHSGSCINITQVRRLVHSRLLCRDLRGQPARCTESLSKCVHSPDR